LAPVLQREQKNPPCPQLKSMGAKELCGVDRQGVVEARVTLVAALGDEVPPGLYDGSGDLRSDHAPQKVRRFDRNGGGHLGNVYKVLPTPYPNLQQKPALGRGAGGAGASAKRAEAGHGRNLAMAYGTNAKLIEYRIAKLSRALAKQGGKVIDFRSAYAAWLRTRIGSFASKSANKSTIWRRTMYD
jgi:hypothetical protein